MVGSHPFEQKADQVLVSVPEDPVSKSTFIHFFFLIEYYWYTYITYQKNIQQVPTLLESTLKMEPKVKLNEFLLLSETKVL